VFSSTVLILLVLLVCALNHASAKRDCADAKLKKGRRYCCKRKGKGKGKEKRRRGTGRASGFEGEWEGDYMDALEPYFGSSESDSELSE